MKIQPHQLLLFVAVLVMVLMLYFFPQRKSREEMIRMGPPQVPEETEVLHVNIIPAQESSHPAIAVATREIQSSSLTR